MVETDGERRVLLLQNTHLQPFLNLAVEGFLLENLAPYSHALYLWQNDNTVVVGRNQNTYAEVNPDFKGYVTRRLSGGGAVYHDVGNLNFTFVSERRAYSVENNNKIILSALQKLGFNAELSGRNDVTVEGKKISGQAFCLRKDACYHHGTILINSDVERMRSALSPSKLKLQSKGVASVVSRVGNLTDWHPDVTVESVKAALAEAFREFYRGYTVDEKSVDLTDPRIVDIADKLSS
ncbi:MAG: lipoate--protein ligase, partial [Paludibacteraceae bacterium]|nr:lipoate--protein ligase [Paludibacteraceae bacterium]